METKLETVANAEVGAKPMDKIYLNIVQRKTKYVPYMYRSHSESESIFYFVVFKPLNLPYLKDTSWFKYKGMDKCRQKMPSGSFLVLTKETQSTKVHVNALIHTNVDMTTFNGKICFHKYKMYVTEVTDDRKDRLRVLSYMFKENESRPFNKYRDYLEYLSKEYIGSISI